MHLDVAGLTHVGMRRPHNEDNLLLLPEQRVFIVADGMGGHASGEVASRVAVEEVASFYERTHQDAEATWPYRMDHRRSYEENRLLTSIRHANARIFALAQKEARYQKMGTTIVGIAFSETMMHVAHVGDSRAYRFRDGALVQLTEDHSLLNDYIKAKPMTQAEIDKFPHKNVISRALGMGDDVKVDAGRDDLRAGDQYLLCSDGLSGMIKDSAIARILGLALALDLKAQGLVDAANAAGGADNITVVVAQIS